MKNLKFFSKITVLAAIAVCLFACFFFMGNAAATANAEGAEITMPAEPENQLAEGGEAPDGEAGGEGLQTLVDGFLSQLKAKYGEDYETYYNAILAEWGSVEEYLLSLVTEDTPDVAADGWRAFVAWLGEYSPVWGSILAILCILIVILFGKKALKRVGEWLTGAGGKFKTVFASINKMYAAHIAEQKAILRLLGENEKFKAEREALENSVKEIEADDEL
ncbi:MAG: hypothetical protein OSJ39_00530 [Clostridia bacterium]|nr:hypothetical protein [Clostridia bacterium]